MYIDARQASATVTSLQRSLSAQQVAKATARAINHTLAKGKTPVKRELLATYNLHKSQVEGKALVLKRANARTMTGGIQASTKPIPLMQFIGTTQTKTGVSVKIKRAGGAKRIRSAFITTTKRGRRGVFARGIHNADGTFAFRRKRIVKRGPDMPIQELHTVSIYVGGISKPVQTKMETTVRASYPPRLVHELRAIVSGSTR